MKTTIRRLNQRKPVLLPAMLLLSCAAFCTSAWAYQFYSDPVTGTGNCFTCHGDFRGSTSTKGTVFSGGTNHDMHRGSSYMGTACSLCHSGSSRFPVEIGLSDGTTSTKPGIGCTGCHVGPGLRKHHRVNGITQCQTCHPSDPVPAPETSKPPYYGSVDTKVRNPANDVQAALTNENWSVGDFLGLDNDGNNLYDQADYAVGPYRILSARVQDKDVVVTWLTAGGRTNTVQRATSLASGFTDLSSAIEIPGVGLKTNTFVDAGGATNASRFYRLKSVVP